MRSGEGQTVLLNVRRSSEEALKPYGAVERQDETAVAPASCRGRAGGAGPGTARKEVEQLAGVLAMLEGGFEAATKLRSGGTTPAELRGPVGEDDPAAEVKS